MRVDTGRLRVVSEAIASEDEELDDLVDASDGSPSPGAYIQKHRQRRGLSLDQLAVATKIPRTSLELLEQDRFEDLPGPVFVKGFLRCAARALGVSADAVMELLYERERAALVARRQRPITATHAVAATVTPKLPPRVKQQDRGARPRLLGALPNPHVLLWIFVALFVAFLVMAAFNVVGGPSGTPST